MSQATLLHLVIGVAVLILIVARQLTTRRLRESFRLPVILGVIGILEFASFLKGYHGSDSRIALALAGSLVLAAAMGALRAATVRVWKDGGQLLIRGSWLTALLWAVALAAHLGYDYLVAGGGGANGDNVGNATVVLYLTVTLGLQRLVLLTRARRQGLLTDGGAGPLGPAA